MQDRFQAARLFEASTRLERASAGLSRLAAGEKPADSEREAMKWAATFLATLDPDQSLPSGTGGRLSAVQVTAYRPTFYASLCKVGLAEKPNFLKTIHKFLSEENTGGRQDVQKKKLAASLLHELARGLLVEAEPPVRARRL